MGEGRGGGMSHPDGLTLKLGENTLLVLSLLALSTSSFFSVSTMVRLAHGSWQTSGTDPLVEDVVLQLGTKNVLNQKWNSLSWNNKETSCWFGKGSTQKWKMGKWNFSQTSRVLHFVFKNYRISTSLRTVHSPSELIYFLFSAIAFFIPHLKLNNSSNIFSAKISLDLRFIGNVHEGFLCFTTWTILNWGHFHYHPIPFEVFPPPISSSKLA